MAEYTSTPGVTSLNAALMHTLQRHRDILQVRPILHLFLILLTHSVCDHFFTIQTLSDFNNIYIDKGKKKKPCSKVLESSFIYLFPEPKTMDLNK